MEKATTDFDVVATVGLDLAKHVFQVHAVEATGRVLVTRALRRKDVLAFFERLSPCLVGMEACGSAHHWARQLLSLGHDVRLMPPAYVNAYVRRQKNDAADAAPIYEAVTRPSMRFVPVRSVENQAALMHHKVRELLVAQRTQLLNALRSHLAEIGIIAAQGPNNARGLAVLIVEGNDMIPAIVRLDASNSTTTALNARSDRSQSHARTPCLWDLKRVATHGRRSRPCLPPHA